MKIYIDGSNLIHRSHWVSTTRNISPVQLCLSSIKKYVDRFDSNDIYIAWDGKRDRHSVNHRRELLRDKYKSTRDKEKNTAAFKNIDHVEKMTAYLGIYNFYPKTLEADDIIAWLALDKFNKHDSVIISTDQDLLQLINKHNCVYNPIKDMIINHENFEDIVGIPLEKFVEYKSVIGDKSDNIDGLPGVGPKRAYKIVMDQKIESQSKEHKEIIERNIKLICLRYSLDLNSEEVEYYHNEFKKQHPVKIDFDGFERGVKYHNMQQILNKLPEWQSTFRKSVDMNKLVSSIDLLNYLHK